MTYKYKVIKEVTKTTETIASIIDKKVFPAIRNHDLISNENRSNGIASGMEIVINKFCNLYILNATISVEEITPLWHSISTSDIDISEWEEI